MIEEKHNKRRLRKILGLPINTPLYNSSQFNSYDNDSDDNSDGGDIDEMIKTVKNLQEKYGNIYEIYDIEETGIPLYTAQFEPNLNDKQVSENNTKKYKVYIKNPETGKIININYDNIKNNSPINKKTPIKKLLSEIIDQNNIDISSLKFNDNLNPIIWDDEKIKENVRDTLLKIGIEFIKSCKIEEYKYKDIVLVGSMANYTYTPQSDIDLHIIFDFEQIKLNDEILEEFFDAKKDLWSTDHNITIKNHPVECYVQNSNEPYTSMGVFSLIKNEWIRKPIKNLITVDEKNIKLKATAIMNQIDRLEKKFKNGDDIISELKKIKNKIKTMRKNGLYKEGEYSTENLVFKILRNNGYLGKLVNLKNNNMDQNLSI